MKRLTRALPLMALLALAALPGAAGASPPAPETWPTRLDVLVQRGGDEPDAALEALDALVSAPAAAPAADTPPLRKLLRARGLVLATAGRAGPAAGVTAALLLLRPADPLAAADAALVQAALADAQGRANAVAPLAQAALQVYQLACPANPGCDHRSSWRAQMLLSRQAGHRGQTSSARDSAQAAVDIARIAGDMPRQAWALAQAADLDGQTGDTDGAQRQLGQALRLARLDGSPALLSRVRVYEARQFDRQGDRAGARRASESGLALAQQAGATRLVAVHLSNIADQAVKAGQPQLALAAVDQALPLVRRLGSRRAEQVLVHNAALARIALGQHAPALATLDDLLQAHRAAGAAADEADALREFSAAFAAAGQLRTALDLYHRERTLADQIMAANRDAALAELRTRFDREAQQRQIEQLAHESALMNAQLANRGLVQKLWLAGAAVLLLAGVLVAQLYRRVREINRRLAHNHAFLRAQTLRDPLTGLANRRGLLEAAQAAGVHGQFSGALLLVDIDHFKQINDGQGHAAGDAVLVELARRLAGCVREVDVVARWGGEEFLVFLPGLGLDQAQALAGRVLQAVGGEPFAVREATAGQQGGAPAALRVTASLGYGAYPLPPSCLPLSLERAINLVDMALYSAKGQGRNRAIGIASVQAIDDAALRRAEAAFEQACQEGRIALRRTGGPAAATGALRSAVPEPA